MFPAPWQMLIALVTQHTIQLPWQVKMTLWTHQLLLMSWFVIRSLCCVLVCLMSCFFALLCLLCLSPFLLACLSPSVCQYCFLHAFSSVPSPHDLACPPLPPPVPRSLISVSVPWFLMCSLSVRCWCLCDVPLEFLVSLVLVCFGILISVFLFLCLICYFALFPFY